MYITFKNVGHGDSIIIEWDVIEKDKKKVTKLFIIDCKKVERKNPVISYLKKCVNPQIEYLIISHPHNDHYSGMLELMQYCHATLQSSIAVTIMIIQMEQTVWFNLPSYRDAP